MLQCCDAAPDAQILRSIKLNSPHLEASIIYTLHELSCRTSPLRVVRGRSAASCGGVFGCRWAGLDRPFWQHHTRTSPERLPLKSFLSSTRRPHHNTSHHITHHG